MNSAMFVNGPVARIVAVLPVCLTWRIDCDNPSKALINPDSLVAMKDSASVESGCTRPCTPPKPSAPCISGSCLASRNSGTEAPG